MPIKNAAASQKAAVNIDGPISFSAKAILYSTLPTNLGISLSARLIKNILSTPIAKIRNGTTSAEIIVNF